MLQIKQMRMHECMAVIGDLLTLAMAHYNPFCAVA